MPKRNIKIEALDNSSIVAILLEPIQGEGGIKYFDNEFLFSTKIDLEKKNGYL